MPKQLKLKIGGIVLALIPDGPHCEFELEEGYRAFVTNDQPEVLLHIHYGRLPKLKLGEKVFDSGGVWDLYRSEGEWVVSLHSPSLGSQPYRLAIFKPGFRHGDIYIEAHGPGPCPFPLNYPLAEVLMVNLLSQGLGVMLHACGISDGGQGMLFTGTSGEGKSTLAEIWKGREGVTILSDDRVIVRKRGHRFWAYGTPWHGDARLASPQGIPLRKLFFIRHARGNEVAPIKPAEAVPRLLVRSFPPFWDAEGMAFTLDFLSQLSQAVACYELGFVPNGSIVDFVRSLK